MAQEASSKSALACTVQDECEGSTLTQEVDDGDDETSPSGGVGQGRFVDFFDSSCAGTTALVEQVRRKSEVKKDLGLRLRGSL